MEAVTLADYQRGALRDAFRAAVARGDARPLLLPACIIPSFVLPAVFLAVAGRHAYLKPLRYPLAVLIAAVNTSLLIPGAAPYTSSMNMACAYSVGLISAWGTLWALVVLVWTDPWDGERVARRVRTSKAKEGEGSPPVAIIDEADMIDEDVARCLRLGQEYYWQSFPADGSFWSRLDWSWDLCLAWRGIGWSWCKSPVPHFAPPKRPHTDELVRLSSLPEVTYQGFRRHRTRAAFFRNRLVVYAACYMVLDMCAVLMSHDPSFVLGPPPSPSRLSRLHDGPKTWSAQVAPYPGGLPPPPAALFAMPPYLDDLYTHHPHLLALFRSVLGLVGVLSALQFFLVFDQIARVFVGSLLFPTASSSTSSFSTATQLWNYPSAFGSMTVLLDHGMAGFWGGWWHQTFRMAFVAPTAWLVNHGVLPGPTDADLVKVKDKDHTRVKLPQSTRLVGLSIAFTQSAFLHAAGSVTSLPDHACWRSTCVFFLMAGLGVVVQTVLATVLQKMAVSANLPRSVRRAGNVMFALGWLHATQWLFLDDLARSGLWLFEPVPFSVVRLLSGIYHGRSNNLLYSAAGSSRAGHAAWRLYRDDLPSWYTGRTWWETGLAL